MGLVSPWVRNLRKEGSVCFLVRRQWMSVEAVAGIPSGLVAMLRRRVVLIIVLPMLRIVEI
jgi:hypothetical protein